MTGHGLRSMADTILYEHSSRQSCCEWHRLIFFTRIEIVFSLVSQIKTSLKHLDIFLISQPYQLSNY